MNSYVIVCIDDEREVLDSVTLDLELFASKFDIEAAQSVEEARQLIEDIEADGQKLALVLCDHIMPDELGVDYLIELNLIERFKGAKKLLLTGQAGLDETVAAVNEANLDYFISKPWQAEQLREIIKKQLTEFIINYEDDPLPYATLLDAEAIYMASSKKRLSI